MEILNKSKNRVLKWYVRGNTGEFNRKKESGRQPKLSTKVITELKMSKYKRGSSVRKISRKLKGKGENVSKDSVHRYLKSSLGLKAFKRKRKPLLTKVQQQKRLKFARAHIHLSEKDWEN